MLLQSSAMRSALGSVVAALVTTSGLMGVPAGATPAPALASAAGPVRAVIVFDKNPDDPWRSELIWKALRRNGDGEWRVIERETWRAGSGFRGKDATDPCEKGRGWLPNGRYSFVQYDNYWGNLIKGRAFSLGSKACHDGTVRTELFIHTETGDRNRQCADRKGDQVCRWEYPKFNDYRSRGCIKLSPRSLRQLVNHYHRWFDAGTRYPTYRVRVVVRP